MPKPKPKPDFGSSGFLPTSAQQEIRDPVITNNAEGKSKKNPAAPWVFLVTVISDFALSELIGSCPCP
jgi:hypothetical protein